MEISIKRIGYKIGTIGWLRNGLEDGSIRIDEGTLKSNGHHGLFLTSDPIKQFLAAYDQYNCGDRVLTAKRYEPAQPEERHRDTLLTDAAWEALMDIADQWCDQCNAERDNDCDAGMEIKIVRISA